MIEEVLLEIKSAEEKAEQMQQKAFQEGKQIVLDAELKADKERKDTISQCKADFRQAVADAEKKAEEKRNDILKQGENDAVAYVESKKQDMDKVANELLGTLLDKYIK